MHSVPLFLQLKHCFWEEFPYPGADTFPLAGGPPLPCLQLPFPHPLQLLGVWPLLRSIGTGLLFMDGVCWRSCSSGADFSAGCCSASCFGRRVV